jgi:hypothetical protein
VDAQTILYDRGGYLIPYFYDFISAASSGVSGLNANVRQEFGDWDFSNVSIG